MSRTLYLRGMNSTDRRPAHSARSRANRAFVARFVAGIVLYAIALSLAVAVDGSAIPAWLPSLLVLPAAGLMAWANVGMYRSADEFEKRKIAEAILIAFAASVPLILAVGFLQFFVIPDLNWIFAFSILMVSWAAGTVISVVRYR